jgi:putative ATP-dependent endonuclease of OLD family
MLYDRLHSAMAHITHIKVDHFRALKSVAFSLGKMAVLIGENDVGKTSVLNALRTFYTNKKLSDRHDYHLHDLESAVVITVTLKNHDSEATFRRTFEFNKAPITEIEKEGEFKSATKAEADAFIQSEAFFFFPVNRDVAVQFAMTKTALLGKLVRDCVRKRIEEGEAKKSLDFLISEATKAIEEPRSGLESFLRQQMHNDTLRLTFEDVNVDPVDGVSFTPGLSDDRVESLPFANRGAGTQNNLVIALFRYLAERQTTGNLIIALEEPENSLHPKAQRQLLAVLLELSDCNQVICTTHSPVFIERTQFESNVLITRKRDGRSDAKVFSAEALAEVRNELGIRPADALLKGGGNCALVVEGDTEEEAVPDYFEACGLSEFGLGISVINAGGSDFEKMRRICMLLKSFDIPVVVMLDADAQKHADDLNRARATSLTNLEEVVVLSRGTIEDYFPKAIIRDLLNADFNACPEINEEDLGDELVGEDLLNAIKRLMHERKCGQGLSYFKRVLGLKGVKMMRERKIEIDQELKILVEKVAAIATRT